MDRSNHYEAAFEAYLRSLRVAFVPVDEARRTLIGEEDVKSLDFIIVGPDSAKLVVDVKGRRYPGGTSKHPRKSWQNWSTEEDVTGLGKWATYFGMDFRGVLAFVYHITPPFKVHPDTPDLFTFRDNTYLMRAIDAHEYRNVMKPRSSRWGTVHLSTADFRQLIHPFSDFLNKVESPCTMTVR